MKYHISQTLGNIYLSPRPSMEKLIRFYYESTARKFWLTELWSQTYEARQDKIILPQLEWAEGFIASILLKKKCYLLNIYQIIGGISVVQKSFLKNQSIY